VQRYDVVALLCSNGVLTAEQQVIASLLQIQEKPILDECLKSGDPAATISAVYQNNAADCKKWSTLTVGNVNAFLDGLTEVSKRKDQVELFRELLDGRATAQDVFWIVRLIKVG
jgi:hypothetical protein